MKTFLVRNGDFVLSGRSFDEVSGGTKVMQDITSALREPVGSDRFHLLWGSTLPLFVGEPASQGVAVLVKSEVERVISNYMLIQQTLLRQDQLANRRLRFSAGEVISQIESVSIEQDADRMTVRVTLLMLNGTRLNQQLAVAS